MEAKAVLRHIHITPRKARLVVDMVRGKGASDALTILQFAPQHAARAVEKLLKSAVSNAFQKEMGDVDELKVSQAFVDVGRVAKRVNPAPRGRSMMIRKRTSHITLVVSNGG